MTMALGIIGLITRQLETLSLLRAQKVAVLVQPPPSLPFPYILIGPVQSVDWSANCVEAQSHSMHLALWTREAPLEMVDALVGAVQGAMQSLPAASDGLTIGRAALLLGEIRHDGTNQITSWHADYRIRTLQGKA